MHQRIQEVGVKYADDRCVDFTRIEDDIVMGREIFGPEYLPSRQEKLI